MKCAAIDLGAQGLLQRVVAPLAQTIGDLWRAGTITAAHEHFASAVIRVFLGHAAKPFAGTESAPVLVVATPAGQIHELGALLVGAAAANLGWHVCYAAGRLGDEPVRSPGHIHAMSESCGRSTAELYEIWVGRALILMQETADDDPGRCFAVTAGPGEVVVVPPDGAHATLSADPRHPLTFGAWCVRDFGFDCRGVRAHAGLAWFPRLVGDDLEWELNPRYPVRRELVIKNPASYENLGLRPGIPVWQRYLDNPECGQRGGGRWLQCDGGIRADGVGTAGGGAEPVRGGL